MTMEIITQIEQLPIPEQPSRSGIKYVPVDNIKAVARITEPDHPLGVKVAVYWELPNDIKVDRPTTGGWVVKNMKMANRLVNAVNAQKVISPKGVAKDIHGKTYVYNQSNIYSKHMNSELKKLGF